MSDQINIKGYRIIEPLLDEAEGVYRAREISTQELKAIKILEPRDDLNEPPKTLEESTLVLPERVIKTDEHTAIVMEFVEGDTLKRRIEREEFLSFNESVEFARALISAAITLQKVGFSLGVVRAEKIIIQDDIPRLICSPVCGDDLQADVFEIVRVISDAGEPLPPFGGTAIAEYLKRLKPVKLREPKPKPKQKQNIARLKLSFKFNKELVLGVLSIALLAVVVIGVAATLSAKSKDASPLVIPSSLPIAIPPQKITPPEGNARFDDLFAELKAITKDIQEHPELAVNHRTRLQVIAQEVLANEKLKVLHKLADNAITRIEELENQKEHELFAHVSKNAAEAEKRGAYGEAIAGYKNFIESGIRSEKLKARANVEITTLQAVAKKAFDRVVRLAKEDCAKNEYDRASLLLSQFAKSAALAELEAKAREVLAEIANKRRVYQEAENTRKRTEALENRIVTLQKAIASAVANCSKFRYNAALKELQDVLTVAPPSLDSEKRRQLMLDVRFLLELIWLEYEQFNLCAKRIESGQRQIPIRLREGDSPLAVVKISEKSILLRGVVDELEVQWVVFSPGANIKFFGSIYGNPDVFSERLATAVMAFTRKEYDLMDKHIEAAKALAHSFEEKELFEKTSRGIKDFLKRGVMRPPSLDE